MRPIMLTDIEGFPVLINPDKISGCVQVEATKEGDPDVTMVILPTQGVMVKQSVDEIMGMLADEGTPFGVRAN